MLHINVRSSLQAAAVFSTPGDGPFFLRQASVFQNRSALRRDPRSRPGKKQKAPKRTKMRLGAKKQKYPRYHPNLKLKAFSDVQKYTVQRNGCQPSKPTRQGSFGSPSEVHSLTASCRNHTACGSLQGSYASYYSPS